MELVPQLPQSVKVISKLMKKFNLIAGIDISMDTLDVQWCRTEISEPATTQQFANEAKGIQALFTELLKMEPDPQNILICCEHTGVYMDKLATAVQSIQCVFWPVHPMVIKNYQVNLQRIKSDKVDAGKILEFAVNHQHKAIHFHHKDWQGSQIKDLFRLRRQLVKIHTQVKNFKHAHKQQVYNSPVTTLIYAQMSDLINQYISQCEKEIKKLIKQSPRVYNLYKILVSIPGIGPVIAVHLLAITDCFEKVNNYKAFACFIGIAPFEHSSGTSVRRRTKVSKIAYRSIKADIHQGARSIIRQGLLFYEYYHKMKALNKHHNWIMNSISNKIAKIAFDLVRKQQLFDKSLYVANKISLKNNLPMS